MDNKRIKPMEVRTVRVKLEDGTLIRGKINLRSEIAEEATIDPDDYSTDAGIFYNRVSDLFSKGKNSFIIVFDVSGDDFGEGGALIINKRKIIWVFPED